MTIRPDGKWAFDTYVGLEEIVNRRVGENELEAIDTVQAHVDAQKEYASQDRDADGVLEYAQKLISTPGQTDGLYWPADQGDGESPVGDAISEAALEKAKAGEGYFGYRFRILTSQGDNIAGGRYDYVINGNMIGGFALIAWPVSYAETGVKTFVVNQQGIIYERDLGPSTEQIVPFIDHFDPDDKWNVTADCSGDLHTFWTASISKRCAKTTRRSERPCLAQVWRLRGTAFALKRGTLVRSLEGRQPLSGRYLVRRLCALTQTPPSERTNSF